MKKFKKLINITKSMFVLSIVAASVNGYAANQNIEEIYDYLSQTRIEKHEQEMAKMEFVDVAENDLVTKTQDYYKSILKTLKEKNLTTLKTDPKLDIKVLNLNTKNDFDMAAVFNKPEVKIIYNTKGSTLNFTDNIELIAKIEKENLTVNAQDIMEFAIYHELAHVQNYNGENLFKVNNLSEIDNKDLESLYHVNYNGFFSLKKQIDIDIRNQYLENYADFVGSVWYLQANDFSQESLEKLKGIMVMREMTHHFEGRDDEHKIDPYKTFESIKHVVENFDKLKVMNAKELDNFALNLVGEYSLSQVMMTKGDEIQSSVTYKRVNSMKNKIASFRQSEEKIKYSFK